MQKDTCECPRGYYGNRCEFSKFIKIWRVPFHFRYNVEFLFFKICEGKIFVTNFGMISRYYSVWSYDLICFFSNLTDKFVNHKD